MTHEAAMSGSFVGSVNDLLGRLDGHYDQRANDLRTLGRALASVFMSSEFRQPRPMERVAKIRELFDYSHAVLDYLMEKGISRSGEHRIVHK